VDREDDEFEMVGGEGGGAKSIVTGRRWPAGANSRPVIAPDVCLCISGANKRTLVNQLIQ